MSISRVYKILNDIDDLVYIGSTKQILCRRMAEHRKLALKGCARKLYNHMREIGAEHFKILGVREYKDISKDRLKYKEDKYIKIFDTVKTGLNMSYAFGKKCLHAKGHKSAIIINEDVSVKIVAEILRANTLRKREIAKYAAQQSVINV